MSLLAEKIGNTLDADSLFAEERAEVLAGLMAAQKTLSPKYFYDARGSQLFDDICDLPEYYPTRTERSIMRANLPEIAERVGPQAAVIEFGAGSNSKAKQLLSYLHRPVAYVPVEISGEYLAEQADDLRQTFPQLYVEPVVADFTKPFDLPEHPQCPERNLVFFPGSTIGNFTPDDAGELLEVMRFEAKPGGALLIGVDLVKDTDVILAAYNDAQGVTAEFNRNALRHLNSALGTDFALDQFEHQAIYDEDHRRIEMRLISRSRQTVHLDGEPIEFDEGEHIVTEYSHKYSVDAFKMLAANAGWSHDALWTDDCELFSVHFLTVAD